MPSYQQMMQYWHITFISIDDLGMLDNNGLKNYDEVVIFIDKNAFDGKNEEFLDQFVAECDNLEEWEELNTFSYNTCYLLK